MFTFHRPETLIEWLRQIAENTGLPTFRARLRAMPPLDERGLWGKQAEAIRNLEQSLAEDHPRSLIQMATGSGKTFTAANLCYRLIKYADAKRILFLVDRSNLGKQAKLEFDKFTIQETQRKFPAEYNVQHLTHNAVDATSRVCISTVQRIFSILKGETELDQEIDEHSVYELPVAEPVEVSYNPALPPDAFDVIIIDECHRSIYGLWRQVLEYFDAHLIGLTATPTKQTFGFFRQNLVMEYSHDMAVAIVPRSVPSARSVSMARSSLVRCLSRRARRPAVPAQFGDGLRPFGALRRGRNELGYPVDPPTRPPRKKPGKQPRPPSSLSRPRQAASRAVLRQQVTHSAPRPTRRHRRATRQLS